MRASLLALAKSIYYFNSLSMHFENKRQKFVILPWVWLQKKIDSVWLSGSPKNLSLPPNINDHSPKRSLAS